MYRKLDGLVSVAPQIAPPDVAVLAGLGYRLIVNNRPDNEEAAQPEGAAVEAATRAVGLDYRAVPVGQAGISDADIYVMKAVIDQAAGPILAFCRSGTRSTHLWALARARGGARPADLITAAASAGYDLGALRSRLEAESQAPGEAG